LGNAKIMDLGFTYVDGADRAQVNREDLLDALSTGEKKAFYILNVIFEIAARRAAKQKTLIVVDDVADSFDYHNKYAIVQYLKEISEDDLFKLIILTHNFDFLRTVESRSVALYSNCLMARKSEKGISLAQATGIKNVFVRDWKNRFFDDDCKKIASIAFLRNLVEFSRGEAEPAYLELTSMLHWRPDSAKLRVSDLDRLFLSICAVTGASKNAGVGIYDLALASAEHVLGAGGISSLEGKVALSIACRLRAERFMVEKISDNAFWGSIDANQTQRLLSRFKKDFAGDAKSIEVLDRVALITPENIHLNSFMYEPLIDMSDEHLRKLFADVKALS